MPTIPSTKATVFQVLADEVDHLVKAGRLSRADLERKLEPEDLRYLGKQLAPSSWVPISTSTRVFQLLFELDGRGDIRDFMRERGRLNADRLKQAGIYRQFESSVGRHSIEKIGRAGITIASVMLNFTRWQFESCEGEEPLLFRIIVEDAADYPDVNRFAAEAFIERFVSGVPGAMKVRVSSARVASDRIVFTGEREC